MKEKIKGILNLFPIVQVIAAILLILVASTGYMYLINRNWTISIVVGIISMLFSFYYSVYIPRRIKREQFLMRELQKYATNMTFYLQSGYNVLNSLNASKKGLDNAIKSDINTTIRILKEESRIDTEHFKKYNFPAINVFHQILSIKYENGGNPKDLFSKANKSINFELVKRDEMYRRKRYVKDKVFIMMGIALAMPLLLVFFAKDLYATYLGLGILAIIPNVLLFIGVLISLFFLQKAFSDLNIQN